MSIRTLACICTVALGGAATAAHAAADDGAPTETVRLVDLNLRTQAGAKVALRRISTAASWVCGGEPSPMELHLRDLYQRCRAEAIRGAVAQAHEPILSAMIPQTGRAADQLAAR